MLAVSVQVLTRFRKVCDAKAAKFKADHGVAVGPRWGTLLDTKGPVRANLKHVVADSRAPSLPLWSLKPHFSLVRLFACYGHMMRRLGL